MRAIAACARLRHQLTRPVSARARSARASLTGLKGLQTPPEWLPTLTRALLPARDRRGWSNTHAADGMLSRAGRGALAVLAVVGLALGVALSHRAAWWGLEAALVSVAAAVGVWAILRRSNEDAARARQQFEVAFRHAPTGLALVDAGGVVLQANPALSRLLLLPPTTDLVGLELAKVAPTESTGALGRAVCAAWAAGEEGSRVELHIADERGDHWLVASLIPLKGSRARVLRDRADVGVSRRGARLLLQVEEVTEQRATERELMDRTTRDPLTGLGNRVLLFQSLNHAIETGAASRCSVLFVDLDRFKSVNDTLGHDAGDTVLVMVAHRLRALVRPGDVVTRVGGDEFVVMLRDLDEPEEAVDVADRIVASLRDPIHLDGHQVSVPGSVGVVLPGSTGEDARARVGDADTAMYRAKQAGGNRVALFKPPMRRARERHLQIDTALRAALDGGGLRLWYQPIVNLRTGAFDGVE